MSDIKKYLVFSFLIPAFLWFEPTGVAASEGSLVIENVTVVAMESEDILPNRTVFIRDGRIVAIASGNEGSDTPNDGFRIDGSGKYLMPGLAEMHGHLPVQDQPPGIIDDILFLFASQGVTFVRSMEGGPDHPRIRDEIARGERFGPTLRVASPGFGGGVQDPGQARALVRTYFRDGFDLLKIHEGMGKAAYEAMAEEARAFDISFAGHVPDSVGLLDSLNAGHRTIEHMDNYIEALASGDAPNVAALWGVPNLIPHIERDRVSELVEVTVATGAGIVPTMLAWKRVFDDQPVDEYLEEYTEVGYLPAGRANGWMGALRGIRGGFSAENGRATVALRNELLRALHEGGALILLGSDAPQFFNVPGFSVHHEMQLMQEEVGMSPYQVLLSGTRAIAEFYNATDEFGTVGIGRRADLILVNGNPLDDVAYASDIAGVVVQGKWLSADQIQARLDEMKERRN